MANGWTLERKQRQAQLIHTWRPWEQSTGPKTPEGKAVTAKNADKGGLWRVEREALKELRASLRAQKEVMHEVADRLLGTQADD
ncbi:hypothetical protein EIP75_05640 [Aquabacterium soli]|uniref:Uncharacterized protein n=1 Tax=Aquabacterium soli TaxID=2493092 RepID=A0A426VE34_9BURK|nr:hypothetical protein EIP75_05640 [Aquabacterium soli]